MTFQRTIYTDIDKTAILKERHSTWLQQARRHFAQGRREAGFNALQMAVFSRGNLKCWLERIRYCRVEIIDGPAFINSGGFAFRPADADAEHRLTYAQVR